MNSSIRVRFAPSPTGLIHLGSVRIALFNYIFARQNNGSFILRVEDTDPERNFDPGAKVIMQDIAWLGLAYNEGPDLGGPFKPYFQSERSKGYQERLEILIEKNKVYRCFCTTEELDKKRKRQIALKQPPRYDRACLQLTTSTIEENLSQKKPFIWRFKIDHEKKVQINDLARGTIDFDLANFSDFPLTRASGSFTFIFANAIDDMLMNISHVFRGEDHISNTPCQALLYEAFNIELPVFWHMPIICNLQGKKLSKRDFGFSLQDLKKAGYLPEAINNYLAIIGASFEQEIMSMDMLIKTIDFKTIQSTSAIRYDVEKLTWVNHQWLLNYSTEELCQKLISFIAEKYPQVKSVDQQTLVELVKIIQPELKTLTQAADLLGFYFEKPTIDKNILHQCASESEIETIKTIVHEHLGLLETPNEFYDGVKNTAKQQGLSLKKLWQVVRIALTGSPSGPGILELVTVLSSETIKNRFAQI